MVENTDTKIIGPDDELPEYVGNGLASDGTSEHDDSVAGISEPVRNAGKPDSRFGGFKLLSPIDVGTGSGSGPANDGTGTGDFPRRRGRRPGSRNAPKPETQSTTQSDLSLKNIEDVLVSLHFMGAKLMDAPELELSRDEAQQLTKAVKEVARNYAVNIDPKKMALFQLGMVATGIYGPRAITIYRRKLVAEPKRTEPTPIDRPKQAPKQAVNGMPRVPSEMDMSAPVDGFEQ